MEEFNIGDIYIANNRLFAHIITGMNDIGVFYKNFHCSGELVKENDFTSFECLKRTCHKVTTEEFKNEIKDWQDEETKKYRKLMCDLNKYKEIVLSNGH